jgi:hypothetical protein
MAEVELEEEDCANDRKGWRNISNLDEDKEDEGDQEEEGADQGPSVAGVGCVFDKGRGGSQVVGGGSIVLLEIRGRGLVRMSAGGDEVGKSH